ncbi:CsbD family protein [Pseudomonas sp. N3-W]|uniref:CsbD family protein n=1 Tax=Pseudomonas fungipugnans TaxID=3024217 RepID=A0ABT6QIG2_9PSED|nr:MULTISPECIES: CsbD family protein [unclassified Pseudomonas]MDI2590677.1 CsbD family protein [Pseudomonas sp. 681]UWF47119.1 CsbD family protein [Pseudomonas sp. N3-W]
MSREHVKGAVEEVAGKAQNMLGELTGDQHMQLEGNARQAAGRLQQHYGEALDDAAGFVKDRPLTTLAIVAGLGLVAGLLLHRRQG